MKNKVGHTSSTILNTCSYQRYRQLSVEASSFFLTHPLTSFLIIPKVIKHKKLNRQSNPCEDSKNYNFADCINEKLMLDVGCQPNWFFKPEINITLCSNISQLNAFDHKYTQILSLNPEEINRNIGCLKPCIYMEYRVTLNLIN